jgi:hypothetical protein
MYHQKWQSDHQKQIIAKMSGKMPGKSNNGKRKIMKETIIIPMVVAVEVARSIVVEEDAEDAEEAKEVAVEEAATL